MFAEFVTLARVAFSLVALALVESFGGTPPESLVEFLSAFISL